jgi:hypothetical protein
MNWRHLSVAIKTLGGIVLLAGFVIHGIRRNPNDPQDRQRMILGTEVLLVGSVILLAGAGLGSLAGRDREQSGDP